MNRAVGWQWAKRAGLVLCAALALGAARPPARQSALPKLPSPMEIALRGHVEALASDDFAGREPGTEGESRTLRYLARQWFDIGLEPGTNIPGSGWFAPVDLIERQPLSSRAAFTRAGRRVPLPADSVYVVTSGLRGLVQDAPLVFVGHAAGAPPPRAELAGRIALMLDSLPAGTSRDAAGDRVGRLLDAGALAVLTVLDDERTLPEVIARRSRAGHAVAGGPVVSEIEGFVTAEAVDLLLPGAHHASLARLKAEAAGSRFVPHLLGLRATLEATSRETRIRTHNLIGRLPGRSRDAGAVLVLAHWDHFGTCAAPPAPDVICNGAIDNASGLAVITEAARLLARGRPLERDVYFLATTAEEVGLLGAVAFAENPPIPLDRFVAALNVDSTGLAPAGSPLGVVGKGLTPLDPLIAEVAGRMKRRLADGDGANAYIRRQDSWVLLRHDLPTVMVSNSYGDMTLLERFMQETYHRPSDQAGAGIDYGGMADDVMVQVELIRAFADPRRLPARGLPGSGLPGGGSAAKGAERP